MSFPKYPHYKDSGVEWLGEVPEHWEVRPVASLAEIINGYPFDSAFFDDGNDGFPLVRIRDLGKLDTETRYKGQFVERAAIDSDDVLIGMDGDFNVGRWLGTGQALLNQRMCCVRAQTPLVTRFMAYSLPTPLKLINSATYATTVKHLASSQVEKIRVSIPSTEPEIRNIVLFLDRETAKIDALIAEQQRLIELLKEKRQAVISHAVTRGLNPDAPMKPSGVEWLGDVPAHWEVMSVRRIAASVQTGRTPAGSSPNSDSDSNFDWFTPRDFADTLRLGSSVRRIGRESVISGDVSLYPPGSVLIVSIGATLGKVGFSDKQCSSNQQINAVVPSERVDGYFLAYSLSAKSDVMRYLSNASTIGIMNQEKTKEILLAVPPVCEQLHICTFVDKKLAELNTLRGDSERAITLLQERRAALISAAVTGKIDVRGIATTEAA